MSRSFGIGAARYAAARFRLTMGSRTSRTQSPTRLAARTTRRSKLHTTHNDAVTPGSTWVSRMRRSLHPIARAPSM